MPSVGETLAGKYRLDRLLGEGGMGMVFAATNTWTGKRIAIKTLHPQFAKNETAVRRFWQEARAATKVQHPNIIDVLDLGVDEREGGPFIVQEFLDGITLKALLEQRGKLTPAEALNILAPVCAALVATHRLGVVHRDMKPDNIFLARTAAGVVPKVIDFGISKIVEEAPQSSNTQTGFVLGTPSYMSPEQAAGRNRDIDAATDVWAMGVVLYEALSGRLPFEAETPQLTLAKILYESAEPLERVEPGLPEDVVSVVGRALEKDKALRFPSIARMTEAILDCATAQTSGLRSTIVLDAWSPPLQEDAANDLDAGPPTLAVGTLAVERESLNTNSTQRPSHPLAATHVSRPPVPPGPARTQMQWASDMNEATPSPRRRGALLVATLACLLLLVGGVVWLRREPVVARTSPPPTPTSLPPRTTASTPPPRASATPTTLPPAPLVVVPVDLSTNANAPAPHAPPPIMRRVRQPRPVNGRRGASRGGARGAVDLLTPLGSYP